MEHSQGLEEREGAMLRFNSTPFPTQDSEAHASGRPLRHGKAMSTQKKDCFVFGI